MHCVLLIPVYDDTIAVQHLIPAVDVELRRVGACARVVLVDDGSPEPPTGGLQTAGLVAITEIDVVRLRRNLGHQRAIAIGLCYLEMHDSSDFIVVMDGDGEDRPVDVPALLAAAHASPTARIVFAERTRRSEGFVFHVLYICTRRCISP
jgi:polyisoprenyl-phosphate glycosyltransferase